MEINIKRLIRILFKHKYSLFALVILCSALSYVYSSYFMKPSYSYSIVYKVNFSDDTQNNKVTASGLNSQLNFSSIVIPSYIEILKLPSFYTLLLDNCVSDTGHAYSADTVSKAISINQVEGTAIFKIHVSSKNENMVSDIGKSLITTVPDRINEISSSDNTSVTCIDSPAAPSVKNANVLNYSLAGAVIGFGLSMIIALIIYFADTRIHSLDEIREKYTYPVLASIPSFPGSSGRKGGSLK